MGLVDWWESEDFRVFIEKQIEGRILKDLSNNEISEMSHEELARILEDRWGKKIFRGGGSDNFSFYYYEGSKRPYVLLCYSFDEGGEDYGLRVSECMSLLDFVVLYKPLSQKQVVEMAEVDKDLLSRPVPSFINDKVLESLGSRALKAGELVKFRKYYPVVRTQGEEEDES